ncbi:MAG: sigma factor-like helix-turn-helix DNA-binding protein [bacterium]|nr:sigma factor-like helix-turn-helix DNA-binding protein [bacterium]
MSAITFKPKQVVKRLLSPLSPRALDVMTKRYGLGENVDRMTLEAIGKTYGITRERVRQIENFALAAIKKADVFKKEDPVFAELNKLVVSLGGVVCEEDFLMHVSKDVSTQNHLFFLLVLGDQFSREKEDENFRHRWIVDDTVSMKVHDAIRELYKTLSHEDLIPESEIVAAFLNHLKDVSEEYKNEEITKRWLSLSKTIAKNPLGEWGMSESHNVNARGMRDYAYLIIRKHGSPMHFTEVAKSITQVFGKKAHVATCHNELIKDKRFVLVGRGLYALSSWGYEKGVVRDVIAKVLKKEGALTKQDIIDRVLKERYVKENTVFVNLQDTKLFKKTKDGKYALA